MKALLLVSTGLACALSLGMPALAQDSKANATPARDGLAEIVVTAQHRSESRKGLRFRWMWFQPPSC
jgi:hypothetical protein